MNLVELLGEVLLALLVDDAEAGPPHQAEDDVQVPADAAVHLVGDHALVGHVVLDDDQAAGTQRPLAAPQELHQVVVRQVTWRRTAESSNQVKTSTRLKKVRKRKLKKLVEIKRISHNVFKNIQIFFPN